MKILIIVCLLAVATARPEYKTDIKFVEPRHVATLRDERILGTDGSFAYEFESEDGIYRSEAGRRLGHVENHPIGSQGTVRFTFPNGEKYWMKYVANENGFQPESSHLPVAPAFPHPIPQFVIDQIEKAAREDAEEEARQRFLLRENKDYHEFKNQ